VSRPSSSVDARKVPICDLGKEYLSLKPEISAAVERVLASGHYVLGPEGQAFERALAEYSGVKNAVGVNSGTDAVLLALRALNVGAGDEVILPAMTFFASAEPIVLLGAKPVFADIDPESFAILPDQVAKKITSRTKTIIAVHLYGQMAPMDVLVDLARAKNIPLIEDMAQAIGAEYKNKKAGTFGTVACLSFFPTKNLGACGDAGAVLTPDRALAERLKKLRNHGAAVKYHHEEVAYNSRLDELQAAILSVKLKHLDAWNEKRRAFAAEYTRQLAGLPLTLPNELPGRKHTFHLYCVLSEKRDALKAHLEKNGIAAGLHYPAPLHLQPAFASLGHRAGEFPNSERLAAQTVSLPLFPQMSSDDVAYVSKIVRGFYAS
jgi:dTDP-4-amino-4,6-dideoxygalactose transaminase